MIPKALSCRDTQAARCLGRCPWLLVALTMALLQRSACNGGCERVGRSHRVFCLRRDAGLSYPVGSLALVSSPC